MSWKAAFWFAVTLPMWIVIPVHIWQSHLRPRLIPARKIDAMADLMLAAFGAYAEHEAFLRQRDAWYRGDRPAQGAWMRIRRRLRRRWSRGEIELYDGDEVTARQRSPAVPSPLDA